MAPQINCFLTWPDFAKFEFRNVPEHVENVQDVSKSSDLAKIEVQKSPRFENTTTHATMRFQAHLSIFGSVPKFRKLVFHLYVKIFGANATPAPRKNQKNSITFRTELCSTLTHFFLCKWFLGFLILQGRGDFWFFQKDFYVEGRTNSSQPLW